jgi:hypothetical protein
MSTSQKIIVPATTEPISLADAKAYLRVDFNDEDTVIQQLITRARAYAEMVTHRALATQSIRVQFMIERPAGGELSGPTNGGPNWYQYQEQLGANPFGAAQFYFDLPSPPIDLTQPVTVQTKITAFDTWTTFPQISNNGLPATWIDDTTEPARMYFQNPQTANFWKFEYTCGYNASYPCPHGILQPIYELIAFFYENREAVEVPQAVTNKLLMRRVDWI